jgi:hypothetical protein
MAGSLAHARPNAPFMKANAGEIGDRLGVVDVHVKHGVSCPGWGHRSRTLMSVDL